MLIVRCLLFVVWSFFVGVVVFVSRCWLRVACCSLVGGCLLFVVYCRFGIFGCALLMFVCWLYIVFVALLAFRVVCGLL